MTPRTITVKGIGKVSVKPDYVVLSMSLETKNEDYARAMDLASRHIQHLTETICAVGFEKSDLKTTGFEVGTEYKNKKDKNGRRHREFAGYVISHDLKLSFDFSAKKLSQALSAIADCLSHPELSIEFTVKDTTAISEEMLRSATVNAKRKAEIMCEASGAELGQLLTVDYNWKELHIFSRTNYSPLDFRLLRNVKSSRKIDFEPDDIHAGDTATFIWEIK